MKDKNLISRRSTLKGIGTAGLVAIAGPNIAEGSGGGFKHSGLNVTSANIREKIFQKVLRTPLVDTHEHLFEEKERLAGASTKRNGVKCDDWALCLSSYLMADIRSAGMSEKSLADLLSPKVDPIHKWSILEPIWPAVKNTGYAQAINLTFKQLYDVDELSSKTIKKVQAGYERVRRRGFYKHILCDLANIESCQVNCLTEPFKESDMPTLLMQDLSILGMFAWIGLEPYGKPSGITVKSLADWYKVIDWWFNKYGRYAVAVKSQNAYVRDIDYEKVPSEKVESIFKKKINKQPVTKEEWKMLQDHLFWYAVKKADEFNLPVKLHTGYYAGNNKMPLSRLIKNPGSATELCRLSPKTRFVFMHICYPYYEELISVAKQFTNAYIDMCWSWIINPVAAKDFLKKYLVTAPANKVLTFGGDYGVVETVAGHAAMARHGIALALSELVEEGWFSLDNALGVVDDIMYGNARRIFNLKEKHELLKNVKWG